jgi:nicotinamidase-related amidase
VAGAAVRRDHRPGAAARRRVRRAGDIHQVHGDRIYELVDDFAPERTLDRTTFGKWGPELAGQVGSGRLVLAGVSTDCCVLSTALAAADAGTGVQVVADACAGASDESHQQTLDILRLYDPLIEVVTVADIIGP